MTGRAYPEDIRPLTGLRIAAALWVLVYHFRDHLGLDADRLGLVAKGYLGVDLFFVLSGFILSHVYLRRFAEGRFHYGSFLWARLSRIYPVHLVTLGVTILIWLVAMRMGASFSPVAFDPGVLPQHLLLIHAWGATPTVQWNFPSWSISAEWFAYLTFPLVAALVLWSRRRPAVGVAAAMTLFAIIALSSERLGLPLPEITRLGVIRVVPAFLTGAALYGLGRRITLPRRAAMAGLFIATAWIVVGSSFRAPDLAIWPAFALLILSLAEAAKTDPRGGLGAAPLVYLGEVSYAVYMTHAGRHRLLPCTRPPGPGDLRTDRLAGVVRRVRGHAAGVDRRLSPGRTTGANLDAGARSVHGGQDDDWPRELRRSRQPLRPVCGPGADFLKCRPQLRARAGGWISGLTAAAVRTWSACPELLSGSARNCALGTFVPQITDRGRHSFSGRHPSSRSPWTFQSRPWKSRRTPKVRK